MTVKPRTNRCLLDSGHEGGHVYPTRKPILDRYQGGEFPGRTLRVPGVTVPGDVPRCRSTVKYRYVAVVEGQEVLIDVPERYVLLLRAYHDGATGERTWRLYKVADDLADFNCWWRHGSMPHFRVVDQTKGHIWEPELRLVAGFRPGEEMKEVEA